MTMLRRPSRKDNDIKFWVDSEKPNGISWETFKTAYESGLTWAALHKLTGKSVSTVKAWVKQGIEEGLVTEREK